jgi:hypothetical protein
MSGWIKIYRDIREHWIWDDPIYLKAWIGILLTVNHEEKKVLIQGQLIECKRGQSVLSLSGWVKCFGKKWTMQKVRTFFELLKQDQMIVTEGLQKTTRLTVCKYDDYQFTQQANNKQTTSKQQANNKQITTNKNKEEGIKNEKNINVCFEIFWNLYDKKVGSKSNCERKWNRLNDEVRQKIIDTLPKFKDSIKDKQFQPYPETYLNQERWNDEFKRTDVSYPGLPQITKDTI